MSLKSAAFLALIGTILLTILALVTLMNDMLAVSQGLLAPVRLLTSVILAFAALSVAVFFFVYHRTQS
jgi:hypothetical protein